MKVACFSLAGEQLTQNNVARPNGWRFFEHLDWQGIAMFEPDVVYVGGWFAANYGDWQVMKGMIGRAKKVIIQWFGSDVLIAKGFYDQGEREMFRQLNSDRYVNVPPTDVIRQEIEKWLEVKTTEPLNVPAEEVFNFEGPNDGNGQGPLVAIYMPPGRQDFFRMAELLSAVPMIKGRCLFYHWMPEMTPVEVRTGPNPGDVKQPDEGQKAFGLTREQYRKILHDAACAVRVPVHDAHSITGAEFLMAGKPFVSDRDMPQYRRLIRGETNPESIARAVNAALKRGVVEKTVSDYYRDRWDPSKYAERLSQRCRTKWPEFSFGTV